MILEDYLGHYLRRKFRMIGQYMSQELGIAYYRTMSKFVQYRRNVLKNNIPSLREKILQNHVFAQGIMQ